MVERVFYELAEKIFQLEKQGKKVIRMNFGDTNLSTPTCAVATAVKTLREKKIGYGSAVGLLELREAIAEREDCKVENVVVGPGSKHLIYALLNVTSEGGKVVFPSPHWPSYEQAVKQLKLEHVVVETSLENNWQFENLFVEGVKTLIICNPLNPTSTIYSEKLLKNVLEEAVEKNVVVILDEAYKGLSFKKIPDYDAIRVRSFSKEFNMEGWRLGYAIAPVEVVKKIVSFNQVTSTCVPEFVQRAGVACLENEREILSQNKRVWKSRMRAGVKALKRNKFKFATPESGIYAFVTHNSIKDCEDYALRLLDEENIAVAPGTAFGGYKKFVRICFNQPEKILVQAIESMANAL